ncbi:MAG TPA: MarP family serine protease [Solirubrobacterales bacterium]|nr:MarP family serine protease [Solirubrobacterales bacterium]
MTVLDWAIVAFTLALALWGYRQGLIVGALTLAGFGVGAFLGSRLGPVVLSQGSDSPYAPLCGAIGALLVGALAAVMLEGMALALRRRLIRRPFMHRADGAGGAALIGAVALGLAWIFGAVALHAPGTTQLRADVQNSVILRELDQVLPPSGGVLNVLDRVDPAPSITGPATPRRRPDPAVAEDPDVEAASDSVVRVLSTACGLGIEGSGWVVQPNLIVTNAHVIAGATDTTVTTQSGVELDATAVYYEPENDLALLRVDAQLPTLGVADGGAEGAEAAVLGYPENGPYTVTPARVGETRSTVSEDSYGRGPVERTITALGGDVRSGNSGGPLVDTKGEVVGVVFAATTSGPRGGFAVPAGEVLEAIRHVSGGEVSTGPCTR